jgi:hypothetical protein
MTCTCLQTVALFDWTVLTETLFLSCLLNSVVFRFFSGLPLIIDLFENFGLFFCFAFLVFSTFYRFLSFFIQVDRLCFCNHFCFDLELMLIIGLNFHSNVEQDGLKIAHCNRFHLFFLIRCGFLKILIFF